ncbi:hypothetical protein I8J29_02200 [Paenibacillus sp. MWE-103]|uniref:BlaR1 peptidase M56 n=1 Tax=Paenibacillus artemisiicola TaxID=1172618 RepID=A0ABS3W460_9BACL|nr:hypothetical protein [Paenibacillus artemisiicola]MBO7742991.1 hypothetical protein [Paenibacillus artemisiicola]
MMIYALVAAFAAGACWRSARLWQRHLRREAFVVLLLSFAAACYMIPQAGRMMPTAPSVTTWMYRPLYHTVSRLLGIEEAIP